MKKIKMPVGALKRRIRVKPDGDTGHTFRWHRTVAEIENDKIKIARAVQNAREIELKYWPDRQFR